MCLTIAATGMLNVVADLDDCRTRQSLRDAQLNIFGEFTATINVIYKVCKAGLGRSRLWAAKLLFHWHEDMCTRGKDDSSIGTT